MEKVKHSFELIISVVLTDSVVVRYLAVSSRVLRYMTTETDEGKETLK